MSTTAVPLLSESIFHIRAFQTMFLFSLALLAAFAIVAVLQFRWSLPYQKLFRSPPVAVPAGELPVVCVLMSLRGADPDLPACLRALFRQDYPRHQIRIVVDSITDPAWQIVDDVIAETGAAHVRVETLGRPLGTCGLRVNAFLQLLDDLPPDCDVVAWLDADTMPYPAWLRDMVGPFHDPAVGATSGTRWYVPVNTNPGTLLRTAWNTGGVQKMVVFGMAFGGSLAYRADLLRRKDVRQSWSRLLWEDIITRQLIEPCGYRLEFVGNATLPTRENISLPACMRFITRQMLNVRLYHDAWPTLVAYSFWVALAPLAALSVLAVSLYWQDVASAAAAAAGMGIHAFSLLYNGRSTELAARRTIGSRGDASWKTPLSLYGIGVLTPGLLLICVIQAMVARSITWRGITYSIHSPHEIRLQEYQPWQHSEAPQLVAESI